MKTKDIQQVVLIYATPARLFDLFLDNQKHADFTGAETEIEKRIGGKFSTYDGYAWGEITALEPGKKIALRWKAEEEEWPNDHWSEVEMLLEPVGADTTRLTFTHHHVPEEIADQIAQGWYDFYWEPLNSWLEEGN